MRPFNSQLQSNRIYKISTGDARFGRMQQQQTKKKKM